MSFLARRVTRQGHRALFPSIPAISRLRFYATASSQSIHLNGRSIDIPTGLFIDGKFVAAKQGNTFSSEDPATGKPIIEIAEGRQEDVDEAVKVARRAFNTWKDSNPMQRAACLNKLADLLEKNADDLIAIECADTGKTIQQCSNLDLPGSIGTLRYYAGWADKIEGLTSFNIPGTFAYTRREPVGVCGQIIPWKWVATFFELMTKTNILKLSSSDVHLENRAGRSDW